MQVSLFHSLRFRLIFSVVVVEVVMLSIMVWSQVESSYSAHIKHLHDTATIFLHQFAHSASIYMAEADYAGLDEQARTLLQNREIKYLLVVDLNSRTVVELGEHADLDTLKLDTHPTRVTDGIFDIGMLVSLAGRPQGRLFMGFSLDSMQAKIALARNRSIGIAAMEIVLSVLVTIVIGVKLTRSLQTLSSAALRVGKGQFDILLPVVQKDEVGLTAQAFNTMVLDIAERSHQLEERQHQIELLMNSTAEAIVGIDSTSRCMFVNAACLRILGYTSSEKIIGKDFHEIAHHSHADGTSYPKDKCTIRIAATQKGTFHTDKETFWRSDGCGFPVEVWTYPIVRDGEKAGYMITFIDITQRKQNELMLKRLNKQIHLLLESTGEGIFGVDRNLNCTFLNKAASQMLGYDSSELIGKDMHQLVHAIDESGKSVQKEKTLIFRTIVENRSFQSDYEGLWTKSREYIPAQYSSSPISESGKITGAVVVFRNVAEARALAQKMDYLATHDPLTGLVNRHEFEARLQRTLTEARIEGSRHVLAYLDLDQFKIINDTCGHVAGDELLRQLTALLHEKIRQDDTFARLGGDEFGVLMGHCDLQHGKKVLNEICRIVRDFRFVWGDRTFIIGMSIGATAITKATSNVTDALSEADAACYLAKDSGRNRVYIYHAADTDSAKRQGELQWVARIRKALDENQLALFYQSIVPINNVDLESALENKPRSTDQLLSKHFEVLLRMREKNGNYLLPGAFLPAAERYELMPAVDRWVLKTMFTWMSKRSNELRNIQLCTINVSGHALCDESFVGFVLDELLKSGIPGEKICFEITETAAVANLTQAKEFIQIIREQGCFFTLDDFGSGMSSFAYLKNLPVDFLKIDGNFVRDIVNDPIDYSMVEAINQVGHVMGIKTVAEFVENKLILQQLTKIGVDYVQGYGIDSPRPLLEFENTLAKVKMQ